MNRLLYGDYRGQSNLQGMWASTSFTLFLPSLSQTKLASPTVLFQEAMQHQDPALKKQEGGEALLSQECCSALACCAHKGVQSHSVPHKQAAPQVDAIKKDILP